MTHHTHDDDASEQLLRTQHAALDNDLTNALDLDAGLREVLILAQHTKLGDDLAETLDLAAGLAAIVPESVPVPTARQGTLRDLAGSPDIEWSFLKSMHITSRWFLRTEMLTRGLDLAHEITSIMLRDFQPDSPDCPASSFFPDWAGWFTTHMELFDQLEEAAESGFLIGRNFLDAIPSEGELEVAQLRGYWLTQLVRAVDIKDMARKVRNAAVHGRSGRRGLIALMEELRAYSKSLADTIHALNDFVGEDMWEAGVDKSHLDGLRWSLSTKWPPSWQEEIARDSVPIGNGVFEVQQGNTRTTSFV